MGALAAPGAVGLLLLPALPTPASVPRSPKCLSARVLVTPPPRSRGSQPALMEPWSPSRPLRPPAPSDSPLCESASAGDSCHGSGLSDVLEVSGRRGRSGHSELGGCSSEPWLFGGAQAVTSALLWKDRPCLTPRPRGASWDRALLPRERGPWPTVLRAGCGAPWSSDGRRRKSGAAAPRGPGRPCEGSSRRGAPACVPGRGLPCSLLWSLGRGPGPGSRGSCGWDPRELAA